MFTSVLVANRGVVACRIIQSLQRLGVRVVAVHSEADRFARHALLADRAVCIGDSTAADCYSQGGVILDAARICNVDAVHPGCGALSANPDFAEAVERLGMVFIGPDHGKIRALTTRESLRLLGAETGATFSVSSEGQNSRSHDRLFEVYIFGDGRGRVTALGDSESILFNDNCCAVQVPAAGLNSELLAAMRRVAVALGLAVRYRSVGSVRFGVDEGRQRIAVHSVRPGLPEAFAAIEVALGIDLVEWMVRTADGQQFDASSKLGLVAVPVVAVQVDVVSHSRDLARLTGIITGVELSNQARTHIGVELGSELSVHSDRHLMTLVASGASWSESIQMLALALRQTEISGIETNLDYLRAVFSDPELLSGNWPQSGAVIHPRCFEVLRPGTFTLVVDYPGRLGYWPFGIPPSGPMDDLSHRFANRIVGNSVEAAALEMTLSGPALRFDCDSKFAFVGAALPAWLDECEVAPNRAHAARAGQILRFGSMDDEGTRAYLAIRGGIRVTPYLNSSTTFTLGGFGGHNGRALRSGDVLRIGEAISGKTASESTSTHLVELTKRWEIGVLYGPHAAPEFFTERDIEVLFEHEYEVHYNSNRTGIRLIGPKPDWARADGGEAGLHPSNIHDVPYAVGSIDFTGDMPILLGPDGPSLGGFVCPATVVSAELWKLGQLRPGDSVRFVPISDEQACELQQWQCHAIETLNGPRRPALVATTPERAILGQIDESEGRVSVTYRRAGDRCLLVEYGPMVLDLRLRFRVHALMLWLNDRALPGIIELTPGIRSLQVHFDDALVSRSQLLDELERAELELADADALEVPSRILHLPLSWDDPETRRAIQKYTQSVRADAPWCPSNIEFIRRINGLESEREVYDTVFGASYLVLGLGDVYLGAPVATPIDPRHRLVTTKYNPARTWTPENAVGIGGAYLCVYGMEGPGGYQFVGRTIQMYNRYRRTSQFTEGRPWLLRFFDQLRFYPVTPEQLLDQRRDFLVGKFDIAIEETQFKLAEYQRFLSANEASITRFKNKQQTAFEAERQRWIESGQLSGSAKRTQAGARLSAWS